MSPLEHAFFASGLMLPEELDEALARQLIFGGDISTSVLEVTRLSEEQVARVVSDALGREFAPPPWQIHKAHTRAVRVRGVPALVIRATGDGGRSWALVSTGELSPDQLELAKAVLKTDAPQLLTLELRAREAEYQLGTQAEDERFLRLTARFGRFRHELVSSESLPEPLLPLRTEFVGTAQDDLENTAPPPMDYEDLAARAAVDATPSSRLKAPTTASESPESLPIEQARSKDELILAALNLLNDSFRFAACFAVQKGEARGILARARNEQSKSIDHIGIPLDFPSVFQKSLEGDATTVARPKASGLEGGVLEDLNRSPGTEVLLLPVRVRKRPVLLLWVDDGRGAEPSLELGKANTARTLVARALERLLLDRKRSKLGAPPSQLNVAEDPFETTAASLAIKESSDTFDVPSVESSLSRELTPVPGALPPAGLAALRHSAPARPVEALEPTDTSSEPPPSRRDLKDIEPRPPSEAPPRFAESRAPIAAETYGRAPMRRPVQDEAPRLAIGRILPSRDAESRLLRSEPRAAAVFTELGPRANESSPQRSPDYSPSPHDEPRLSARTLLSRQPYVGTVETGSAALLDPQAPPPSLGFGDGHAPASLRPSQLPPPDEYESLIDQLDAGDESVLSRFVDGGEAAVAALMMSFPGRVSEPKSLKVRAAECGPVLKALVHIGRRAIPFLTVRTWDESPTVRRWATLTLGELPSKDSGEAIATRLLDRSPEVRRAALAAARRVQTDSIARRALRATVEQSAFDTSLHADSRAGAIESLVDIREPEAIPTMLKLMEDSDKSVRRAAKWALTVLLRQDFGADLAAWRTFWEEHRDENRMEWLILALDHPSSDLRRAAGDELTTLVGDSFGFEAHVSPSERRLAQLKFRTWWDERGRLN